MPDYLSQVQEEGSLGQYEELGEGPGFPGPSSSVQMPVISQVSSSTPGCEGGFLSPDSLEPLEAPALKQEAGVSEGLKTPPCSSSPSTSPDVSQEENVSHIKELDAITIE